MTDAANKPASSGGEGASAPSTTGSVASDAKERAAQAKIDELQEEVTKLNQAVKELEQTVKDKDSEIEVLKTLVPEPEPELEPVAVVIEGYENNPHPEGGQNLKIRFHREGYDESLSLNWSPDSNMSLEDAMVEVEAYCRTLPK